MRKPIPVFMGCCCSVENAEEYGEHELPTLLGAAKESRKPVLSKREEVENVKIVVSCHASEGSKWHLELLAVSAELKKKLLDPQFAATRCDLDASRDLDMHELKQAARVYGISDPTSGSSEDHGRVDLHQQLMAGQRMSKESFAELVALRLQGTPKVIRALEMYSVKFWC